MKYESHSLSSSGQFNRSSQDLSKFFGSSSKAKNFLQTMQQKGDQEASKFELVTMASSGSGKRAKDVAVYYNKEKDQFVTKVIKRKRSDAPAYVFPKSLVRPSQLNPTSNDKNFSLDEDNSYSAKTPRQFENALARIKSDFNAAKVPFDKSKFSDAFKSMQGKRSQDQLIKEQYKKGNKLFRVFYNFERQEMMVQEIELDKKDPSKITNVDETVYDLTTEYGYQGARNALVSSKVYTEDQLDHFRGVQVSPCLDILESHILPDLSDFENVTDALWDRHLQRAVANEVILGENRSLFLELNILDKPRRVKVHLDAKGQVANVEWVGMSEEDALKEGLKLDFKTDEDGQRNYLISTNYPDGKFKPALGINADNIRVEGGILKGSLAVFVKGKKNGEFEYEDFEKSIFPFELDAERRGIANIGKRQRLNGSAKNYYDIDAPIVEGSGGIKNGFFKLFFSDEGKREFVRDTIYENATEAMGTPEYQKLITNREIWNISNNISYQLGKKTGDYSTSVTDITAKGAELAYATFGDEILLRVIKDMLPEESPVAVNNIVLNVTEAFKECLARAGKSRNKEVADKCMEIFKSEAPVYVGREVLLLKLRQNDLGAFEKDANETYMSCVKEYYRQNPNATDSTNKIKGCLYKAFLGTIDKAMEPTLDKEVSKIVSDKGYDFKLSPSEKSKLLSDMKSCFREKNFESSGSFGTKYNFSMLQKMEPANFESSLMDCVSNIKVGTGRIVVSKVLGIELNKQDLTPEAKERAEKLALAEGYEACVQKQSEVIKTAKDGIQKAAEKAAVDSDGRPTTKSEKMVTTPTLEPGECANLVMNRTLAIVVPEMVKKAIGSEFYESLLKNPETVPEYIFCFDREEKRLLDELPYTLKNEAGMKTPEKAVHAKKRATATDKAHAGCLKEALSWASFHAVGQIVEETLKKDPELNSLIKLTPENKVLLGNKIRACFDSELKNYNSVNEMTDALEPLKEKCGVKLLLDASVQEIIFSPIVIGSLKNARVKEDNLKTWSDAILKGMNEDMKDARTIDEVISKAKDYKGKAAIQVIDFSLKEQISGFVLKGTPAQRASEIKRLMDKANQELLSKDGQNFEARILEASLSKEEGKMDQVIDEFKLAATKLIGPEVVEMTGKDLIKDGLLESEAEVKVMRARAERVLKDCLDKKPVGVGADEHIEECVIKVKSASTEWVISTSLVKNLTEEENSRIFDIEDQERIVNSILDEEAKKEIDRISRIENKEEASRALKLFTISIKSKAAGQIVKGVIPYTLNQVLTVSNRASDQMRSETLKFKSELEKELIGSFDVCIENYKKNSQLALSGNWSNEKYNPDEQFDACANRLRFSSMEKILPFKFNEILSLLNKNEKENSSVVKENQRYFDKCTRDVDVYMSTKDFKYQMDACAAMTVFEFTRSAIMYARDLGDGLFVQNPKTMEEWDACIQRMRGEVVEKLAPYTDTKALLSFSENRDFISEAFRINANVKDDKYEPVTMDWISDRIKKCGLESLAPNLIQEYKMKVITDKSLKLTAKEQAVTSSFLDSFSRILTTKYEGKPVDFGVDVFVKELNEERDKAPKSNSSDGADYISIMEEFQPLIYKYVKDLVNFDSAAFIDGIKDFEQRVKRAISLNKGKLSIPELKDILVDSKLGEVLLKSLVSKIVKDKATEALKKQGVDPEGVIWQLTSPAMINRIFDSKSGQEAITHIKRKLKGLSLGEIFELLDTKNTSAKKKSDAIMKDINGKVIDTLASDTINGGFVETLLGPIVQKKLTEKRDGVESGFTAIFKVPIAGLMGYNRNEFHWGTRWDNRSYSLRNTPSGKQAVRNFANYVLKPMMKDGLSDSEVDKKVEEHVTPKIEAALGENGVGLWE